MFANYVKHRLGVKPIESVLYVFIGCIRFASPGLALVSRRIWSVPYLAKARQSSPKLSRKKSLFPFDKRDLRFG